MGQIKAMASSPALLHAGYRRIGIDGGWVCQNDAVRAAACVVEAQDAGGGAHQQIDWPLHAKTTEK